MTEISKSKIAIVGAGLIGQKHIEVVSKFAQIDAIVDPNPQTEGLAHAKGVPWFEKLENYLGSHKPDGAIVATPNQLHLAHGSALIKAGVPILVEKPLAENSISASELAGQADAENVPVLVGHHRRHSPLVKRAKAAIDAGDLGKIVTVNAQFWLYKPEEYFDVPWRRQEGAGPTFINLIHDIDLLRYFCGDIVAVQAMESRSVRGFDVEDSSVVIAEFETGTIGTISISDTVVAPWSWELTSGENPVYPKTDMSCYMLGGTKGSLSVPDMQLWTHPGKQSWWEPIEANHLGSVADDPVEQQFLHFLDVIENCRKPLVSAHEGLKNLQVLDAIKIAALHRSTQAVGEQSGLGNANSK